MPWETEWDAGSGGFAERTRMHKIPHLLMNFQRLLNTSSMKAPTGKAKVEDAEHWSSCQGGEDGGLGSAKADILTSAQLRPWDSSLGKLPSSGRRPKNVGLLGAGEMAWQLRVPTVLAKELSLPPNTYFWWLTTCNSSSRVQFILLNYEGTYTRAYTHT